MEERVCGVERNRELISEERFKRRTKQAVTTSRKKMSFSNCKCSFRKKTQELETTKVLKDLIALLPIKPICPVAPFDSKRRACDCTYLYA